MLITNYENYLEPFPSKQGLTFRLWSINTVSRAYQGELNLRRFKPNSHLERCYHVAIDSVEAQTGASEVAYQYNLS